MKSGFPKLFGLLILCAFVLSKCTREDLLYGNREEQVAKIANAKQWFANYQTKHQFNEIFATTIFQWDKAKVFRYKNGYEAVVVKLKEPVENDGYIGRRYLYLFPWKNGKGYYTSVLEAIPTMSYYKLKKGILDYRNFDGHIFGYSLKSGYFGGARYENSKKVCNVTMEYGYIANGDTLSTVTVTGSYPPAPPVTTTPDPTVPDPTQIPNTNPCEYISCSTQSSPGENLPPDEPEQCDPTLVSPEEQEFNAYVQMIQEPSEVESPESPDDQDTPITYNFQWDVAKSYSGSWKIVATTFVNFDKSSDMHLDPLELVHTYTINSYHTPESHFIGSQLIIQSTYNQASITDEIPINNSRYTYAKTTITGSITHKLFKKLEIPYCGELNLEVSEDIRNFVRFTPK